jgi:nicotinate-nucleotide adenylyltransferase
MNIALFGTSADPPTIGHLEILRWIADRFDRGVVWAADNPFKGQQTPLEHRTQMLRLLVEELQLPQVQVQPDLSHPRTLITVERAQQRYPEAKLTLVVGGDVARQLPQWFRVEELLQKVNLLVVPRSGYSVTDLELQRLRQLGATVAIAPISVPGVSSTAYRECHDGDGIPQVVQAYIDREQLYQCDARAEKQPAY